MKRRRICWRGVVQDFVALKLDEHSPECVFKHLENLYRKMKKPSSNIDFMVKQDIIPRLVAILHHRHGDDDNVGLKVLAVDALKLILDRDSSESANAKDIVKAGAVGHLLNLMSPRHKALTVKILPVFHVLMDVCDPDSLSEEPGVFEALVNAALCRDKTTTQMSLDIIRLLLMENIPSWNRTGHFISRLLPLLGDEDFDTVTSVCTILDIIAKSSPREVTLEMMKLDVLPLFAGVLKRAGADSRGHECVIELLSCVATLVSESFVHAEKVRQSGLLECLLPFLRTGSHTDVASHTANVILATVMRSCDSKATAALVELGLVPSVDAVFRMDGPSQRETATLLLNRLILNRKYVSRYMDQSLLSCFAYYRSSGQWHNFYKLLVIFKNVLETAKNQDAGKLSEIRNAVLSSAHLDSFFGLERCDKLVESAAEAVVQLCLRD